MQPQMMEGMTGSGPVRLLIRPVYEQAKRIEATVLRDLPTHQGLAKTAREVAEAAEGAERLANSMRRLINSHRLPLVFLVCAVGALGFWSYWNFIHVSSLSLAVPDANASSIRRQLFAHRRVNVSPIAVPGSAEAMEMVAKGQVDLAFIQGGIAIPPELLRLETPNPESILWLVKEGVDDVSSIRRVLTSAENQGSHLVAKDFLPAMGVRADVAFAYAWKELLQNPKYAIPEDVQAAFLVKDPSDDTTRYGVNRLLRSGFALRPVIADSRAQRHDYARPTTLPRGFLQVTPTVPGETLTTYSVSTFLVAREGLTPRLLAQAARVLDTNAGDIASMGFQFNTLEASELIQGAEGLVSILVDLGIAFIALLGLDVLKYRRQFHGLNSLVSVISMLQSSKDLIGQSDPRARQEVQLYLRLCSDLLGLVSAISGYYTQQNSSLLFNNLSQLVHQRCDGLKLNIQVKLLHALVREGVEPL